MSCYTVIYTRKSTEEDDRQILSLDAQERECRSYASRQGIRIDELIREAHSARKPGRPLFTAMLQKVERLRRKGASVRILCHKPDRLLRNLADYARISDLMDTGVECEFVTGSYPNNAQGKMAFGINVIFAKYYVDNLSEEVRKGMRQKVEGGEWPGPVPLGYAKLDGKTVVVPEIAPLIRRAFRLYASGRYSLRTLAHQLKPEGLTGRLSQRHLAKSVLQDHILTNPFYCGLLRYRGELFPGNHEPLVSVALFERVQHQLRRRYFRMTERHDFRYRGLLRCARCGGAIVGDAKRKRAKTYTYYRCSHRRGPCSEGYIREEALALALGDRLTGRLTLPDWISAKLHETAERMVRERQQDQVTRQSLLGRQSEDVTRRLSALLDLRLGGEIDEGEYARKRQELVTRQAGYREQQAAVARPGGDPRVAVAWFVDTCASARQVLETGTQSEVRTLLQIVGSNYQLGGGMVNFEPVEPFTLAAQAQNRPGWWPGPDVIRKICQTCSEVSNMQ